MGQKSPTRVWAEYLAARLGEACLSSLDPDLNVDAAKWFGRAFHAIDRKHARRAADNIALTFPDWPRSEADRVAGASFEHFAQLAVEVLHTPRLIRHPDWAERVQQVNLGAAIELLNGPQPVILVTGHLGNWELLGSLLAEIGYDLDAIARPLDNPRINDWLMGVRQRGGMRIITKWDASERMVEVMERGGALGFIADQNAGDKGMFVPFLGRMASTYKSIGLLALKFDAAVVCGYAHRVASPAGERERFRYELGVADVIHPEQWKREPDPLYYVTARYSWALEKMVRMRPEQYLWMHRRWKSRPKYERQGKPMPASVRRSLGRLPWLTEDDVEALARSVEVGAKLAAKPPPGPSGPETGPAIGAPIPAAPA
ncbi:MAG: lysophospholipid acyltransferase family protein [Planctomycetota bacterium]